jgi:hypothetical protein
VSIESNLSGPGSPARFMDTLGQLADHLIKVNIVAETYDGNRAMLMYDCLVREPVGAIRMVEFLDLNDDGSIQRIRRVYDVVALRRLLPAFDT